MAGDHNSSDNQWKKTVISRWWMVEVTQIWVIFATVEDRESWGLVSGGWQGWFLCWPMVNSWWKCGNGGWVAAVRVFNLWGFLEFFNFLLFFR